MVKIISIASRIIVYICKVLNSTGVIAILIIIALVDHKKQFLDVEIGWPGSVADSRVFDNSYLSRNYEAALAELGTTPLASGDDGLEENIPAFILGDSAYRNSRHLVTTFKVTECNADRSIRHLNYRLSKARYVVENVFGLLKGRFQVFEKPLRCAIGDVPFAVHLISSICVLHNFLLDAQDQFAEEEVLMQEIEEQRGNGNGDGDGDGDPNGGLDDTQEREPEENGVTRQALLRHIRWLDELDD
jgi:hypothetical protein